jgi:hypothetical protein
VWGCEGQDLNAQSNVEAFVRRCETQGDAGTRANNIRRVMQRYNKLKAKGQESILCFDCSGFIYWDFKAFVGLIKGRRTAASYYAQCRSKTREDLRAGDLVFVHNGSRITHVGLYAGDGMVIHCKGRDVGVIEELISKHGWNRYGRWPLMYDDDPVPTEKYVLTKGTLNIRTGPSTEYPIVGVSKRKDKFPWVADDPKTGWHEIEYKGQPAWITGKKKYTEVIQG